MTSWALHKQKLPSEIVEQVYSGKLRQEVITLETVLKDYVAYKSDTSKAEKEITQRVERLRKDMQHIYGKQKLKYVSLNCINRQDANDLRYHLLSRVSANSAFRMLGVVRTAINHAIVEHSLNIPNVFTNLCLSPLELCQYILAKGVRKHGSNYWGRVFWYCQGCTVR